MATSMQKFNCETLALSIEFDEKDFNKTAFRADLGQEKSGGTLSVLYLVVKRIEVRNTLI